MTRKNWTKVVRKNKKPIFLVGTILLVLFTLFGLMTRGALPKKQLKEKPLVQIASEWETHVAEDGFLIKSPSNWNFYTGNEYSDGSRLYLLSNTVHEEILPRNLGGQEQYVHLEFWVSQGSLTESRQRLLDYFNRNPNSPNASTFLFFGNTPASFSEETLRIGGREAIRFVIDEESWEQERRSEEIIVELSENRTLAVNRYVTEFEPPVEQAQAYRQAVDSVIENIKFLD